MNNYDINSIKSLDIITHIRERSGMYLPNKDIEGLHHLLHELLDNSIDEYLAGFGNEILVEIHRSEDGDVVIIEDHGRGVPFGYREDLGMDVMEAIFSKSMTGGKFDSSTYSNSAGTYGVGSKCVTALSKYFNIISYRGNKRAFIGFKDGYKCEGVQINETKERGNGTHSQFKPDPMFFTIPTRFDIAKVKSRLKFTASILSGLRITFKYQENGREYTEEFFDRSKLLTIQSIAENCFGNSEKISEELFIESNECDLRLRWFKSNTTSISSFMNTVETPDKGSHVQAVLECISGAILKLNKRLLSPSQVSVGMSLVMSARYLHPVFRGQAKTQVSDSRVKSLLYDKLYKQIFDFLSNNPNVSKYLISIADSQEKAIEELEIKSVSKDIVSNIRENRLPIKLTTAINCTPEQRELIIVEGNSAAGALASCRNPTFQEIIPIKGKILNPYKSEFSSILKSKEVLDVFNSIGGIEENYSNIRCHTVILACDADMDGKHIYSLVISLFVSLFPSFLKKFNFYLMNPPLFVMYSDDKRYFGMSPEECKKKAKHDGVKVGEITRMKGLGEMDSSELSEFIDPKTRSLTKIVVTDESDTKLRALMGTISSMRQDIVRELENDTIDC